MEDNLGEHNDGLVISLNGMNLNNEKLNGIGAIKYEYN